CVFCCRCVLLVLFQLLSFSVLSASLDCLVAEQGCIQEQSCMILYRLLEYCTAEEAVSPLSSDARLECLEAQNSLQRHRPLQVCKCQRGSRREEPCLRVYWTVRFAGNANILVIFYVSRGSSLSIDGQNQCLKAAQDCGLYEKCGSLRSEYVVACTKRTTASDNSCNRQKCHKALRQLNKLHFRKNMQVRKHKVNPSESV
uniref:GDNF/GAS1 domain-containing protein n=1 Tax=Gouania willdenowi TaxID=441366 RepID=A0A8C5E702_GOUWI